MRTLVHNKYYSWFGYYSHTGGCQCGKDHARRPPSRRRRRPGLSGIAPRRHRTVAAPGQKITYKITPLPDREYVDLGVVYVHGKRPRPEKKLGNVAVVVVRVMLPRYRGRVRSTNVTVFVVGGLVTVVNITGDPAPGTKQSVRRITYALRSHCKCSVFHFQESQKYRSGNYFRF